MAEKKPTVKLMRATKNASTPAKAAPAKGKPPEPGLAALSTADLAGVLVELEGKARHRAKSQRRAKVERCQVILAELGRRVKALVG